MSFGQLMVDHCGIVIFTQLAPPLTSCECQTVASSFLPAPDLIDKRSPSWWDGLGCGLANSERLVRARWITQHDQWQCQAIAMPVGSDGMDLQGSTVGLRVLRYKLQHLSHPGSKAASILQVKSLFVLCGLRGANWRRRKFLEIT